jgi:hypothetical protein
MRRAPLICVSWWLHDQESAGYRDRMADNTHGVSMLGSLVPNRPRLDDTQPVHSVLVWLLISLSHGFWSACWASPGTAPTLARRMS